MILSTSAVVACCCTASLSWRVRMATRWHFSEWQATKRDPSREERDLRDGHERIGPALHDGVPAGMHQCRPEDGQKDVKLHQSLNAASACSPLIGRSEHQLCQTAVTSPQHRNGFPGARRRIVGKNPAWSTHPPGPPRPSILLPRPS